VGQFSVSANSNEIFDQNYQEALRKLEQPQQKKSPKP